MPTFVTHGPMKQDSVMDVALSLQNEEWVRKLSIGSSWTKLRVGVLISIGQSPGGGNAAIPTGYGFAVGVCSGTTNPLGAATTTNFIGYAPGIDTGWSAGTGYAGDSQYYSLATWGYGWYKTGTVITKTSNVLNPGLSFPVTGLGSPRRSIFIVEITKGTPNYDIAFYYPNTVFYNGVVYVLTSDFTTDELKSAVAQLGTITLRTGTVTFVTDHATLAVNEAAGLFDTVDIYSTLTQYGLDIYSVAVEKLA